MDLQGRLARARDAQQKVPGVGERYGHLVVIEEVEPYYWRGRISRRRWRCECDCGQDTAVRDDLLRSGKTTSCGCEVIRVNKVLHRTHGYRADRACPPEYGAWRSLVSRARDGDYRVARAWTGEEGFKTFLRDVGPRPSPRHRLARLDLRKAFGPGNAAWCTDIEKRGTPRHLVEYRGHEMTLREVAEATGLSYTALQKRLSRGWEISEVFGRPPITR